MTTATDTARKTGRVVRVTGPVVDVEFPRDAMPELFSALHADVTYPDLAKTLTLEVAQHLGDNVVRTVSMEPTDGLVRGADVTNTGGPISVPVGDGVKGHVFNALGQVPRRAWLRNGPRALGHPPEAPGIRPARGSYRGSGDRPQGRRPPHALRAWWKDRPLRWCGCW